MSVSANRRSASGYTQHALPFLFVMLQAGALTAGAAHAQAPVQVAQADRASGGGASLEEIIVTATKRADSVNRIPITITALPQNALVEQELRSIQDISNSVPGLFVTSSNGPKGEQILIRGVGGSAANQGAPTTGIYLDDVPLQKRLVAGDASGSGSPFPPLFDLDRVEVLKGPQGTLYGESSEGGAVRFITPQPSLDSFSGTLRAELSGTENGGINYEVGAALGGPIVPGKVGFRASVWNRYDSGYIDHVYINNGQTLGSDTNTENRYLGRIAVLFQPTDNLRITPTFYISRDHNGDSDDYTEQLSTFSTPPGANLNTHTYGPYNFYGPYKTSLNCNIGADFTNTIAPCYEKQWRTNTLNIDSVSIDYDFDAFSIHSSTAYIGDTTKGLSNAAQGDISSFTGGAPFLYNYPEYHGDLLYDNARQTITEELRFTSAPDQGPFSWVGGLFYSNQQTHQRSQDYANLDGAIEDLFGLPTSVILGAPSSPNGGGISQRDQHIRETEYAAFGEGTYAITDDLKATVGLRVARDQIKYYGYLEGPFFGFTDPTFANGGLSGGDQFATSVLPKFSVQYQLDEGQMVYATVAKGERSGGVNTGAYTEKCQPTFKSLGLNGTPETYDPDTLWSYELGAKIRTLGGKAQLNASGFYIDWSKVQATYSLPGPCYFDYVANAGGAVSKGGDIQGEIEALDGLKVNFAIAYTDAYYTNAVTQGQSIFINKGDTLPTPPLSIDVGVRYAIPGLDDYKAYIRADYRYDSSYKRGFGPGTANYDPATYTASQTQFVTLRTGITVEGADVALFVDNLFNSRDVLNRVGGGACANRSCTAYSSYNPIFQDTTFRPRTVGLNANYKFGGSEPEAPTPAPYVPPPVVAPVSTPRSYLVFFDFNQSDLTPQAVSIVDQAAANAGPAHVTQLTVTGHTDTVGSDAYNMRLSRRRAESVAAQLEKDGIASSEIEIVAKGKHDLLVPTADGVKEPQNRRVQIVYSGGAVS
jgi:iron complex outermembrane receptor protein